MLMLNWAKSLHARHLVLQPAVGWFVRSASALFLGMGSFIIRTCGPDDLRSPSKSLSGTPLGADDVVARRWVTLSIGIARLRYREKSLGHVRLLLCDLQGGIYQHEEPQHQPGGLACLSLIEQFQARRAHAAPSLEPACDSSGSVSGDPSLEVGLADKLVVAEAALRARAEHIGRESASEQHKHVPRSSRAGPHADIALVLREVRLLPAHQLEAG